MQVDAKVWSTTKTGFKVHAFKGGEAVCRKNIKQGPGRTFNQAEARTWVLGTPGLSFCTDCEYRFDFLVGEADFEARCVENAHTEALAMNEEFGAKAAPAVCCEHAPMYHGARGCDECGCATSRSAHQPTITDSKENDDVSIKEGPLTERQIRIINHLREGKRHEEIAGLLEDIGVSMVKQECQNIRAKFRTSTVTQAVSLWATAQAYRETATLIGSHRPHQVDNAVDSHVDHVLYGLIQILRERADRLTPR